MVVNILIGCRSICIGGRVTQLDIQILGILSLMTVQLRFKMAAAADKFKKQY